MSQCMFGGQKITSDYSSLLPSCVSLDLNSDLQAWQQVILHDEPFFLFRSVFIVINYSLSSFPLFICFSIVCKKHCLTQDHENYSYFFFSEFNSSDSFIQFLIHVEEGRGWGWRGESGIRFLKNIYFYLYVYIYVIMYHIPGCCQSLKEGV